MRSGCELRLAVGQYLRFAGLVPGCRILHGGGETMSHFARKILGPEPVKAVTQPQFQVRPSLRLRIWSAASWKNIRRALRLASGIVAGTAWTRPVAHTVQGAGGLHVLDKGRARERCRVTSPRTISWAARGLSLPCIFLEIYFASGPVRSVLRLRADPEWERLHRVGSFLICPRSRTDRPFRPAESVSRFRVSIRFVTGDAERIQVGLSATIYLGLFGERH